ncbi:MAG TPA: hypothetical protein VFW33_22255, partial [Gemmataceae bacterium]|nr:hypothetical protein [Gemmataceae bacterium]
AACTFDQAVRRWDLATLDRRSAPGALPGDLAGVALSPDGSRLAVASRNTGLYLWEPDSDRPASLADKEPGLTAVAFAPGGLSLVCGGAWGGPLKVRDTATGKTALVPALASGRVNAVAFAPDGRLLAAACSDGTVRLWDVTADEPGR